MMRLTSSVAGGGSGARMVIGICTGRVIGDTTTGPSVDAPSTSPTMLAPLVATPAGAIAPAAAPLLAALVSPPKALIASCLSFFSAGSCGRKRSREGRSCKAVAMVRAAVIRLCSCCSFSRASISRT
jgi:hypothetical protein